MKLTTKARYGTRALLDLALHSGEAVQLKHVAERQAISKKYLEQLLAPLKAAGIVVTTRGPAGGYKLAVPPEELGLGRVLRILEGPLELVDCVVDGGASCKRAPTCAARGLWVSVAQAIEETLDRVTLADLVETHYRLTGGRKDEPCVPTCEPDMS